MSLALAAAFTSAAVEEAEHAHVVNELPMSPVAFGVVAMVAWIVLLGITFCFRSVGTRHG